MRDDDLDIVEIILNNIKNEFDCVIQIMKLISAHTSILNYFLN